MIDIILLGRVLLWFCFSLEFSYCNIQVCLFCRLDEPYCINSVSYCIFCIQWSIQLCIVCSMFWCNIYISDDSYCPVFILVQFYYGIRWYILLCTCSVHFVRGADTALYNFMIGWPNTVHVLCIVTHIARPIYFTPVQTLF